MSSYNDFLKSKVEIAPVSGFEVDPDSLNPALKPHQRDAVAWALRGGKGRRQAEHVDDKYIHVCKDCKFSDCEYYNVNLCSLVQAEKARRGRDDP